MGRRTHSVGSKRVLIWGTVNSEAPGQKSLINITSTYLTYTSQTYVDFVLQCALQKKTTEKTITGITGMTLITLHIVSCYEVFISLVFMVCSSIEVQISITDHFL